MPATRILLVEDDPLVRLVTAEVLRDDGFEVTEACTGDKAIELLTGPAYYDVLLTDVQMPGALDGIDVAVRARELDPGVPVVIVSGYAAQLTERLSGLNPPATFLRKPYRFSKLLDVLWRLTLKA